jgi:type IV pilus assembly protein PilA
MPRPHRAAFTLIELLIVVVIIGILAAIAIPKFSNSKERAYITSMRSDLRNLATAQESYYYTNDSYSSNIATLNYTTSSGVSIAIPAADSGGWSAVATHALVATEKCAVYFGTASSVAPATVEGQITCS